MARPLGRVTRGGDTSKGREKLRERSEQEAPRLVFIEDDHDYGGAPGGTEGGGRPGAGAFAQVLSRQR